MFSLVAKLEKDVESAHRNTHPYIIEYKKNEIKAEEALARLREGNRRFAMDLSSDSSIAGHIQRYELADGQQPFAIILGCSDSRVPVEMIFDQGLGDLFVIRVAGNIVAPSQIGSVEFAASQFGTQLVVVMGHSKCGAVQATLDEIRRPTVNRSKNLSSIVDRIGPAIHELIAEGGDENPDELLERAVRANVQTSANHLRHGSDIIETMIGNGELLVVGAEYDLKSGIVEFFDVHES